MSVETYNLKRCLNRFDRTKPCSGDLRKISENVARVLTIQCGRLCNPCRKLVGKKVNEVLGKKTAGNTLFILGGKV